MLVLKKEPNLLVAVQRVTPGVNLVGNEMQLSEQQVSVEANHRLHVSLRNRNRLFHELAHDYVCRGLELSRVMMIGKERIVRML